MGFDLINEIRSLRKQISGLKQQLNKQMMTGTVTEVRGDRIRLNVGTADNPVNSPWLRLGGMPSGKNGGGHSQYVRPGIGEPMLMFSPGGKIGPHSRAMFGGPVDNFPSPGTAEQDGYVHSTGDVKQTMKDGEVRTSVGDQSITQSRDGGIGINAAGKPIDVKGDKLRVEPPAKFDQAVSFGGGGDGTGDLNWKGNIHIDGNLTVDGNITVTGVIRGHHIGPHSEG